MPAWRGLTLAELSSNSDRNIDPEIAGAGRVSAEARTSSRRSIRHARFPPVAVESGEVLDAAAVHTADDAAGGQPSAVNVVVVAFVGTQCIGIAVA